MGLEKIEVELGTELLRPEARGGARSRAGCPAGVRRLKPCVDRLPGPQGQNLYRERKRWLR